MTLYSYIHGEIIAGSFSELCSVDKFIVINAFSSNSNILKLPATAGTECACALLSFDNVSALQTL